MFKIGGIDHEILNRSAQGSEESVHNPVVYGKEHVDYADHNNGRKKMRKVRNILNKLFIPDTGQFSSLKNGL